LSGNIIPPSTCFANISLSYLYRSDLRNYQPLVASEENGLNEALLKEEITHPRTDDDINLLHWERHLLNLALDQCDHYLMKNNNKNSLMYPFHIERIKPLSNLLAVKIFLVNRVISAGSTFTKMITNAGQHQDMYNREQKRTKYTA